MRNLLQFLISRQMHIHVRKARAVGKRDVISFRSDEALLAALTLWRIMDLSAKSSDLSSRVDGMSFAKASILVHEDNGSRVPMEIDKTSSRDQRKISNGRLPNPSDMSRWKSEEEMTQASEPVMPPLAPPSIRELRGKEVSCLERLYRMVCELTWR